MDDRPVFIGGVERSGKTYLRYMLSNSPNLAISRRANLWTHFYQRFGLLSRPANLRRCLQAMGENKHIRSFHPDWERLQHDFVQGDPSYARLFALLHRQYARQSSKTRWGDQTELLEQMTAPIMAAFPEARFLHLIRDPRDRYLAILKRNNPTRSVARLSLRGGGLGPATARWLTSANLAETHQRNDPMRYRVVRYESMVTQPEVTMRGVCDFIGEAYLPEMICLRAVRRFHDDPLLDSGAPSPLSTEFIGQYRRGLTPFEITFIQRAAHNLMQEFHYPLEPQPNSWGRILGAHLFEWIIDTAGLLGWRMISPGRR